MKKKQTNYLEKATDRFTKVARKGLKVQTLDPQDNEISKITFIPRVRFKENNNG